MGERRGGTTRRAPSLPSQIHVIGDVNENCRMFSVPVCAGDFH